MTLTLVKADTCQNTFFIYDRRMYQGNISQHEILLLCQQLRFYNRDQVLIITCASEKNIYLIKMLVLEQDASLSDFCGNGALAVSKYLCLLHGVSTAKHFRFETEQDIHPIVFGPQGYIGVNMKVPSTFVANIKYECHSHSLIKQHSDGKLHQFNIDQYCFYYVEALEPHLLTFKPMNYKELNDVGKKINDDRCSFPLGINVNAVSLLPNNQLRLKTYERGANRVTGACGTGATAASYLLFQLTDNRVPFYKVYCPKGVLYTAMDPFTDNIWLWGKPSIEVKTSDWVVTTANAF